MRKLLSLSAIYAVAVLLAPHSLTAQDDVGPEVGSEIDDFQLVDQENEERKFSELLSSGPTAVVFHRSADW